MKYSGLPDHIQRILGQQHPLACDHSGGNGPFLAADNGIDAVRQPVAAAVKGKFYPVGKGEIRLRERFHPPQNRPNSAQPAEIGGAGKIIPPGKRSPRRWQKPRQNSDRVPCGQMHTLTRTQPHPLRAHISHQRMARRVRGLHNTQNEARPMRLHVHLFHNAGKRENMWPVKHRRVYAPATQFAA